MRATKEYRLAMTEEAQKIVDELTLEQKVWLMSGNIDITKMTQEQLAEKVGVRRETIMRLEAGRYNPSLKLAIDISREVETPIEVLFIFEEK